ncbi:hypothetical protein ASC94_09955 [Massilia sp. Root418]|uniref:hypothetical protein n=1 Tax=Massilia sp. Root418 TaxID=1736532 RepID=UPI0006F2CAE7|nr:hypothetical protein [Massilia sp. Root418]KQW97108.1 hypothetical protein ASC94_09955 [Massilia sp. Root418]
MADMSQDEADKHDLRLHRAKQLARQVEYRGLLHFIAGLHWHKGDSEMTVYLEGSAEPVRPCELTLVEPPQ